MKDYVFSKIFLMFVLQVLLSMNLYATIYSGSCGTSVTYSLDIETGVLSITGTGEMTSYNSGGAPWYSNRSDIKTVNIGEGVTTVGQCSFMNCTNITSASLPSTLTSIGANSFYNCALSNITIPSGVISIDNFAFRNNSLLQITLPSSVSSIGNAVFTGNYSLKEVYNLSNLTITKGSTDNGSVGLYALVIHTSSAEASIIKNLGDYVFAESEGKPILIAYNGSDTKLVLPESYNGNHYVIGEQALYKCSNVTSVTIPNAVDSISSFAFSTNHLSEVHISDISSWCNIRFYNQYSNPIYFAHSLYLNDQKISDLIIPNTVTTISSYAFVGGYFDTVTIPSSVKNFGKDAFIQSKIGTVVISDLKAWCSIEFADCITNPLEYATYMMVNDQIVTDLSIPSGVTKINQCVFPDCKMIKSITLPDGLLEIGMSAFNGCKNLETVSLPNSITTIASSAFNECNIQSITLPSNLTSIGNNAFGQNYQLFEVYNLSSLTITKGSYDNGSVAYYAKVIHTSLTEESIFKTVGDYKFCDSGDDSPQMVGYYGTNKELTLPSNFNGKNYWINQYTFSGNDSITSVVIPEGVTAIGGAFSQCDNLKTVTLPNSITFIDGAFFNCSSLQSVNIPTGVSEIDGAFSGCSSLKEITIPGNVNSIGNETFAECYDLSIVNIENGVKQIDENAFCGCQNLIKVIIPESMESISDNAFGSNGFVKFYEIYNLSSIDLSNVVSQSNLTDVTIHTSISDPSVITEQDDFMFISKNGVTSLIGYLGYDNKIVLPDYCDGRAFNIGNWGLCYNSSRDCTINIPSTIGTLGRYIFGPSIKKLICKATNPPTATNASLYPFDSGSVMSSVPVYVPKESVDEYKANEYWKNLNIIAMPTWVTKISLDKTSLSLAESMTETITASITPTDAECKDLNWSSSDTSIATIDNNGRIVAIAAGTATITAATTDGSDLSASCVVIVTAKPEDTDLSAYDNVLYIDGTEGKVGSQKTLSIKMNNVVAPTGFQCDVYLPNGIEAAKDDDGFYMTSLSTERTTTQKTNYFDSALQSDGSIRIMCSSTKSYTFSGNDGEVATITVKVGDDVADGEYPMILKNIVISDANSNTYEVDYVKTTLTLTSYTLGDANGDSKINVGDFTAIANDIMGNPPASFVEKAADVNGDTKINVGDLTGVANLILYGVVSPSSSAKAVNDNYLPTVVSVADCQTVAGTEFTVAVDVNGSYAFSGYQFDVTLPEGISVKMNGDEPCAWLSTARTNAQRTNFFTSGMTETNNLRVLAASTNGYTFAGTNGSVAYVTLVADKNIANGDYTVGINNMIVSANGIAVTPSNSEFTVHVGNTTGIADVTSDDASGAIYDLSGKILKQSSSVANLRKGIYIINGKKIVK